MANRVIDVQTRWMDEGSIISGIALNNRADVLLALGRLDEARRDYERAWKIIGPRFPEDSPDRTIPQMGLGNVAFARGELEPAIEIFERVLRVRQAPDTNPADLAEARFQLAVALERAGRDPERAVRLAKQAQETYSAGPGFVDERAAVGAWLAAHAGRVSSPTSK
jgi:tetratricopeptide (TPR) repeat protein